MESGGNEHEGVTGRPAAIAPAGHDDLALLGQTHPSDLVEVHPKVTPPTGPTGRVTVANVMRLLEHQGFRCALTGRVLTPETASLDHVRPVRRGGLHVIENAQVLHRDVNRAKSTMTTEEFIQLCREVVRQADAKGSTDAQ